MAWLSLDAGDNDPVRFWRHVVAAVGPARPGVAEGVLPLFGAPLPSSLAGLATTLINELAAQPVEEQTVLVLDDYHLIDAQPVHQSLLFLLEHLPPGLQVVLASRSDPPLSLGRLRARGQLAELRAAELRFTADEAAALLQRVAERAGTALSDADVSALTARTEGWAAGLQLAGQLVSDVERVQGGDRATGEGHTVERHGVLGHIGEVHGEHVSLAEPPAGQPRSQAKKSARRMILACAGRDSPAPPELTMATSASAV